VRREPSKSLIPSIHFPVNALSWYRIGGVENGKNGVKMKNGGRKMKNGVKNGDKNGGRASLSNYISML
jgi:hypothetical protein